MLFPSGLAEDNVTSKNSAGLTSLQDQDASRAKETSLVASSCGLWKMPAVFQPASRSGVTIVRGELIYDANYTRQLINSLISN